MSSACAGPGDALARWRHPICQSGWSLPGACWLPVPSRLRCWIRMEPCEWRFQARESLARQSKGSDETPSSRLASQAHPSIGQEGKPGCGATCESRILPCLIENCGRQTHSACGLMLTVFSERHSGFRRNDAHFRKACTPFCLGAEAASLYNPAAFLSAVCRPCKAVV